ncbi:MAG: 4-(cytidine 5'-diphospho)-2-C-methyl-D-erythritol kinase [Bacilli bacterium]|nr:4-(cytidine 5'-diphospho)-2-C-methyl-D-erythritol kinase [Bacilli bacterium]
MYLKANAKINLVLNVKGKRPDGYHDLDMIVLPVGLNDVIAVSRVFSKKKKARVLFDDEEKQIANNICQKVIDMMMTQFNIKKRYEFSIYKKIPIGAGLGGGSSDAAAIFNFYRDKFKLTSITDDDAMAMLKDIGSDIPFFVVNRPARVFGRGEDTRVIQVMKDYYVLIVKPQMNLSTSEIYHDLDDTKIPVYNINQVIKGLATGNDNLIAENIGNALETPAIAKCPKIKEVKDYLKRNGFPITLMTGSGSAVFSLSTNRQHIEQMATTLKQLHYQVFVTTVLRGE